MKRAAPRVPAAPAPRAPRVPAAPAPRAPRRRPAAAATAPAAPRRAVVILPGLGNNAADYAPLAALLAQEPYNLHVEVAAVARYDWARNAAGLADGAYWRGTLAPRPTVDWYLERVAAAADAAAAAAPGTPLALLAHSAGGWLGRLYMAEYGGAARVDRFVSLGSPHLAPPLGVPDQTRGILTYVNAKYPGAHHAAEGVAYVTVAGSFLRGAPARGPGGLGARVVGAGYAAVCGDAAADGDGVVPVPAAHLEGAAQLTLAGVYHSPLGAAADAAEAAAAAARAAEVRPPRLWYGSRAVLPRWGGALLDPARAGALAAAEAARAAAPA